MDHNSETPYATEGNLLSVLHECRFAGGLAASGQQAGFGGNLFTRDTCRMVLDTMDHAPSMAREMLGILPQLQGTHEDPSTNEFPDALPHQVFKQITAGRRLPDSQVEQAGYWLDKWQVPFRHNETDGKWFAIYNSSDGPLLYLIALADFCLQPGGRQVLGDTFIHKPSGEHRTVAEAAVRCVSFAMRSLEKAEDEGVPFYAVANTNPHQTSPSGVMRDGFDAYFHPAGDGPGEPADYSLMAYIDNQALFYEALTRAATELFPTHENAPLWIAKAEEVRRETLRSFWMDDVSFFAAAVGRSQRLLRLESTAGAEVLNGPFLKDIVDGPDIVAAITRWLYSDGVMTSIGPRMLHKKFGRFEGDYYAYQGSGAVWPYANGVIAKGLRKHGLYDLSYDLGVERTLGWLDQAGQAVELGYVNRETGQPIYNPRAHAVYRAGATALAASLGQVDQGWTATAGLRELWDWSAGVPESPSGSWQQSVEWQVMKLAADIPPASAGSPEVPQYIDVEQGELLKRRRAAAMGIPS
jgi:glycogen debranching enzyme